MRSEDLDNIIEQVSDEVIKAYLVFKPFHSAHEGYAIIREEVDELWDEVKDNDLEAARKEAIQVAAMAIRFLLEVGSQAKMDNRRKERHWEDLPKESPSSQSGSEPSSSDGGF